MAGIGYGVSIQDGRCVPTPVPAQQVRTRADQTQNSAGGFVYAVDPLQRLHRFLFLGADGGSYYASERQLKLENAQVVVNLTKEHHGKKIVDEIKEISCSGRAPKQDQCIFALAIVARLGCEEDRKAAFAALKDVCRTPTHLFMFVANSEQLVPGSTGWGRAMRKGVCDWYNSKEAKDLAYAISKYVQRNGWSNCDILRLCHVKPATPDHDTIFGWVVGKRALPDPPELELLSAEGKRAVEYLKAVESAKTASEDDLCELIKTHRLPRETIAPERLNSLRVWATLLDGMPMTAMLRNLNKMTKVGVFDNSDAVRDVTSRFTDIEVLRRARLHPLNILVAMHTYAQGKGDKGSLQWNPKREIVDALQAAFYLSFKTVEPTGKRFCLALDVSGSMTFHKIAGLGISCAQAATAMAMCTVRTENACKTMCFSAVPYQYNWSSFASHGAVNESGFKELDLKVGDDIITATRKTTNLPFSGTDCSLPMRWAMQNNKEFDVFVVYTDCETYQGPVHADEALRQYRVSSGIDAKLIVVGMVSNGFTIADPNDAGMLDIVGFDSAAPEIMRLFLTGQI